MMMMSILIMMMVFVMMMMMVHAVILTHRTVFCGTIDDNGTVTNTTEDQCDEELK